MKTVNKLTLKPLWLGMLAVSLTACSSKPIIDTKGLDPAQYEQDLAECEAVSDQVNQAESVGKSAAFGALVAGAIDLVVDGKIGTTTAIGGITGAAGGASSSDQEKATVLKNCLKNRGYTVLN